MHPSRKRTSVWEDIYMCKLITRFAANAPGDAGFDPLNLARDLKGFNNLREAGGFGVPEIGFRFGDVETEPDPGVVNTKGCYSIL